MKKTNETSQPSQTLTGPEEVIETVRNMDESTAANVIEMSKPKGQRTNVFERVDAVLTEAATNKVQLIQHVRERAAEADKLIAKGNEAEGSVVEIAQDIATSLYRGRTQGILTNAEVSSLLGDSFGWKLKGNAKVRVTAADPNASQTPFGYGEAIRKRVVRAVNAYAFVNGNEAEAGAFFRGMSPDVVQPLLNELNAGKRSIWTVYDDFAKAKNDATGQRPKAAHNPKAIAAITSTLGENIAVSVQKMQETPGLFTAYLALYRMIGTIGRELPEDIAA